MALASTREAAKENKLNSDTTHVNEVLQIYMANGGTLPAASAIQASSGTAVVAQLKSRADDASAASTMGITGSVLDARVYAVVQTDDEAASSQVRALWSASQNRYYLTNGPAAVGIKEFRLEPSLVMQSTNRDARDPNVLAVNTNKQWIWDYADTAPSAVASGTTASTGSRGNPGTATATSSAALSAPVVPSGPFSLISFDAAGHYITIADGANPSGVSQIYYATSSGGSYAVYTGSFAVDPGTTVNAYARSLDPDRYSDSVVATGTITAVPVALGISLAGATTLTYAQAGGAMTSSSATAPYATVSLVNSSAIPTKYQTTSKIQTYYGYGGGGLSAAPTMLPQISLGISQWTSGSSSLTVKAQLRSLDTTILSNSSTASLTVTTATTALSAPTISPVTGQMSTAPTVTISLPSGDLPVGAQIYYTLNGATPTTASSLYGGAFTPTTGAGGSISVTAAVFGPAGYSQWFSQSSNAQATYTIASSGSPEGALVGNATVNGTFVGSLIYSNQLGNLPAYINFNSSARINGGNVYFPGLPTFTFNGGSNSIIMGRQFNADGTEVLPNTDRSLVVDLTGASTPVYNVTFNSGAIIQGKVYRRATPPTFPTVSAPGSPSNGNTYSLNSGSVTINPATNANLNINSGTATLQPGNYGSINNGGTIILGTAGATVPSVYNIQSMNLNSNSKVLVLGPVVLTMNNGLNLSNATLGNVDHPEYLQLNMYNGDFTVNSGAQAYAKLVAPNNTVNLNGTFTGSVAAKNLTVNGNGVAFTLPPVVSG
ncbi:hypothetical protein BH09VER1_BH09VER1_09910 [soil metagenome]